MSSVVQQQNFYTRLGQSGLLSGIIALSGLHSYPISIGALTLDFFSIIAACFICPLPFFKLVQKDILGFFLATFALSMILSPENLFAGFLGLKIAFFIMSMVPLAFVNQVDEGAHELLEATAELRREMRRVTWPSVQETLKFVAIVSLFVIGAAIFWAFVDRIIQAVFSILFYYFA